MFTLFYQTNIILLIFIEKKTKNIENWQYSLTVLNKSKYFDSFIVFRKW